MFKDQFTWFEVMRKATPSGINAKPMANMKGKTLVAVKTGCHAGNLCCLNFVSTISKHFPCLLSTESTNHSID